MTRTASLLLDEPTEGVDIPTAGRVLADVHPFNLDARLSSLHDPQAPADAVDADRPRRELS